MGMSIQDLIAGKQKDMAAKKSRTSTLKPLPGKHVYRILPSWRGAGDAQFWHDFSMHFIKTKESGAKPAAVYVCSEKTFGKPCEVCDSIKKLMAVSKDDDMTKTLKEAQSAQRYLMNAMHRTGAEPDKAQTLEVGQGVFESICNLIGEYGDITDLASGVDLVITRTGAGLDTKYSVMPAAKSAPVPASIIASLCNLDEFVAQENPAGETKALTAVGTIAGLLPGPGASGTGTKTGQAALAALSNDIDDADFEEVGTKAASAASDADLDELDDLLG